ncbi:MAG: ATP-dependent RecD-like DNA helicase [Peptoniphilus sp.]|nr:ATP-dependent RecD-like DNA helicase [Peptoniphilus sp.]MDD7363025.1 ATP-dependent RecD-like DNA helicase [Bacillota bacterium]MDY6045290.1 ATP-dependent RecD-like DNA helicase [Peptoniphilus sp.]
MDHIIFRNEDNGYTVANFVTEDSDIVVVGSHIALHEQEHLRLEGELIWHPKYGEQFQFESVTKIRPRGRAAVISYLSGGLIPHVGKVTAKKIVDTFGDETLDVIEEAPERLEEVEGIGEKKLAVILETLEKQKDMRAFLLDAADYELSNKEALSIYKVYGNESIHVIEGDPYRLADRVRGIGFLKADAIAQKVGIGREDERRMVAGMKFALSRAVQDGHCYLPKETLIAEAASVLGVEDDFLEEYLVKLAVDPEIYIVDREGIKVYFLKYFRAESFVARELKRRGKIDLAEHMAEDMVEAVSKSLDVDLADRQKEALSRAVDSNLLVITGGPGTGKTTTLRAIVEAMEKLKLSVALAAPTGRAAKRMEQATGRSASTIHRLLKYDYIDEEGTDSLVSGDEIDSDVVIVDEASMIDLLLMRDLLDSLKDKTHLILVGDGDQLPPVGAGNVLRDILSSGEVETVRLDEIFRQAESSYIVKNAHRINHGKPPIVNAKGTDFFFIEEPDPKRVLALITSLVKDRLPAFYDADPFDDIQVLAPMKKGVCGIENLNVALQRELNASKKGLDFRGFTYRVGDKVMQTKNNYEMEWKSNTAVFDNEGTGVFNGDLGRVSAVDPDGEYLKVYYDDKVCTYTRETLPELQPAYATTIHKSQGSEFPIVVIPILSGPPMLYTRNLLYTGVTRAKSVVVLVGNPQAMARMIENNRIESRYSDLDKLLKEDVPW